MKKITAIICTIAMLAALTACDNKETSGSVPENPESSTGNSAPESTQDSTDNPESTDNTVSTPESSAPEESAPKGEPTFLTCVDGTIIYTSDITLLQGYNDDYELVELPVEELDEERFFNEDCSVICDGFAYAFTSKNSFNPAEDPDKFQSFDDIYEYVGEDIAPSTEYFRVVPGDKFGELTVKSAKTKFYANYQSYEGKDINGAYQYGGSIEFDGEPELTGFIRVKEANEGYDEGGTMIFVPDNECMDKIPLIKYGVNWETGEVQHYTMTNFDGLAYNDLNRFTLGNILDYNDIDLDGLEIGERFTRVKITIGSIVSRGSQLSNIEAKLLGLEKI